MFQSVGDPAASRGGVPNLFRPKVLEGQVELVFVSRVVDVRGEDRSDVRQAEVTKFGGDTVQPAEMSENPEWCESYMRHEEQNLIFDKMQNTIRHIKNDPRMEKTTRENC